MTLYESFWEAVTTEYDTLRVLEAKPARDCLRRAA